MHTQLCGMDNYYEELYDFLKQKNKIYAYPVLNGVYFWENDTFFEMSKHKKHVRAFVDEHGIVLSLDASKTKYKDFVMPRLCNVDIIIGVLKKMEHVNGTLMLRADDELVFVNSFTCFTALSQFSLWVQSSFEKNNTWDNFLNNTLLTTGDEELDCFVFKNIYYFVSSYNRLISVS